MRNIMVAPVCILLCTFCSWALEEYELDNEINKTLLEIEKARAEQKRTREAIHEDKVDQKQYRKRTDGRMKEIQARTDSIKSQIDEIYSSNDSLQAHYSALETKENEIRFLGNRLRKVLIIVCDSLSGQLSKLPPSAGDASLDAVKFLRSELIGKSIDNVEAMQRLFTIFEEVEDEMMNVAIHHGPSPVTYINGMVNRVRIGGVFEAAVGRNGQRVAVWDLEKGKWAGYENPQLAAQLRKAVAIREGKEVPEIISLPLSGHLQSQNDDSTDSTEGAE